MQQLWWWKTAREQGVGTDWLQSLHRGKKIWVQSEMHYKGMYISTTNVVVRISHQSYHKFKWEVLQIVQFQWTGIGFAADVATLFNFHITLKHIMQIWKPVKIIKLEIMRKRKQSFEISVLNVFGGTEKKSQNICQYSYPPDLDLRKLLLCIKSRSLSFSP